MFRDSAETASQARFGIVYAAKPAMRGQPDRFGPSADPSSPRPTERSEVDSAPERILIGGFEPQMRKELACVFRAAGYQVTEVNDRHELIQRLDECLRPDAADAGFELIMIDARGFASAVLHALEGSRRSGWQVPIVVVTDAGDLNVKTAAAALGAEIAFDTSSSLRAAWRSLFFSACRRTAHNVHK